VACFEYRLTRHFAASFQRKVLKPIVLSNGQHIPAGVCIEVPSSQIHLDPELYPEPEKFDALRFYKLREAKHSSDKTAAAVVASSQFVSVSADNLSFGYGRHACPGRFFAANEIKMILGVALMQYELKMPDGIEGRYPNFLIGGAVSA
jgi:cytochrome P450